MTDNIKFPPMPKAHTVVKPKNSEPFGLITTRDALNFAAEAVRLNAQAVPDIDYEALIAAAYRRDRKWAQGTNGCIAFARGAEWFREQCLSAAPAAPQPAQQDDDEGDALTVAYLHGHGKGKDSVQPLLAEKDALLRQALDALELPCDRWNAVQYKIVHDAIEAIRNHLGVKND